MARNPLRPLFCSSNEKWKQYHLAQPEGIDIIRSAAKARVPRTNFRRSTVPWEVRLWQVQRKPTHRQSHRLWIQVHDDPAVRVREQATEDSVVPNGFDVVSCDTCMETVIPIPDADGYAQSRRHACSADLAPGAENVTVVEHLRDGCTRSRIHFVSELLAFPELLEQAAQGLEEHDFADVVRRILDETVDNPLAVPSTGSGGGGGQRTTSAGRAGVVNALGR